MLLLALCAALALCQAVSFQLPFNVRNIFKMKMSDGTQELTGGIGVMKESIKKQFKLGKSDRVLRNNNFYTILNQIK